MGSERLAWTGRLMYESETNNNSFSSAGTGAPSVDQLDMSMATLPRGTSTLPRGTYRKLRDKNGDLESEKTDNKCCPGCSPRLTYALSCFFATAAFMAAANIQTLPVLPWPAIGNLLPKDQWVQYPPGMPEIVGIVIGMFGLHYLRRFGEVLFLHDYRRLVWKSECLFMPLYHAAFGFWMGWSVNHNLEYIVPTWPILASGGILFLTGEIGNCISHVKLWQLRRKPYSEVMMRKVASQHLLPKGFWFQLICCPHYVFEIVTWLGFAMATCTLSAGCFFVCNTFILLVKGRLRYRAYCKEFDGRNRKPRYKRWRKSMIPLCW